MNILGFIVGILAIIFMSLFIIGCMIVSSWRDEEDENNK